MYLCGTCHSWYKRAQWSWRSRTRRTEVDARKSPEIKLINCSAKGWKTTRSITMTGDDLRVSTQAIYFARWPVNGIGGGQCGVVSTTLRASPFRTFHMLGVRHMMRMRIPSNVDTGISLIQGCLALLIDSPTGLNTGMHSTRFLLAFLASVQQGTVLEHAFLALNRTSTHCHAYQKYTWS